MTTTNWLIVNHMSPIDIRDMQRAVWALQHARELLELLIARTPTGPARDALTEANIHAMVAESKLNEELLK